MDLEKQLPNGAKIPTHIVSRENMFENRIDSHYWFNFLTEETYLTDVELSEYLKIYTPLPEWYSWEKWKAKRQAKIKGYGRGERFSLAM